MLPLCSSSFSSPCTMLEEDEELDWMDCNALPGRALQTYYWLPRGSCTGQKQKQLPVSWMEGEELILTCLQWCEEITKGKEKAPNYNRARLQVKGLSLRGYMLEFTATREWVKCWDVWERVALQTKPISSLTFWLPLQSFGFVHSCLCQQLAARQTSSRESQRLSSQWC